MCILRVSYHAVRGGSHLIEAKYICGSKKVMRTTILHDVIL